MASTDDKAPDASQAATPESSDDEMRRRYREALERKHGGGSSAVGPHGDQKSAAPTSNHKTQRTFRRKSG